MLSFSLVKELHITLKSAFWLIDWLGWYLLTVEINLKIALKGKSINTVNNEIPLYVQSCQHKYIE